MLNCNNCVKNDVCSKREEVNKLWEQIQLNPNIQKILNSGSTLEINCNNYRAIENKLYRGA